MEDAYEHYELIADEYIQQLEKLLLIQREYFIRKMAVADARIDEMERSE